MGVGMVTVRMVLSFRKNKNNHFNIILKSTSLSSLKIVSAFK